tara:strand:+ start:2666 stop:4162 length:1497 start_codon:yes stop_codon:yes gene_type:complete
MALDSKILTRLEPTLELDKLQFKSYGEQDGDNPGDNHGSRALGVEFPLIMINNYRFNQEDISNFEISLEGIIPTISLTLIDNQSYFTADQFPRDGDVINVRIASKAKNDYKDIRIDFDIDDVDSPPRSNFAQGTGRGKYSFTGRMKIPGLYAEDCKEYGLGTSVEHLETMVTDLKIGLASNIDTSDDAMKVMTSFEPMLDTITDLVSHSYVSEDSFQTFSIDPWYYLNYVDMNLLLNAEESFEDGLASMDIDYNDILGPDATEATNEQKTALVLSSHERLAGTNLHINRYSLKNNTGSSVKKNGYKRVLQFFDNDSDEGLVSFDIEPLTSTKLKDIAEPLKGRRDEERYKSEIKYKYMGRRHSDPETSNTHLNYTFAELHNKQNLDELDKMYLEVELSSYNPAIRKYQKIPIAIFGQTQDQIGADIAVKGAKEKMGFDAKPTADLEDELSDKTAIDEFLSGFYVVGSIRYTYKKSEGIVKQHMKLLRREWNSRINNIA